MRIPIKINGWDFEISPYSHQVYSDSTDKVGTAWNNLTQNEKDQVIRQLKNNENYCRY
jgi:hypothetical protein